MKTKLDKVFAAVVKVAGNKISRFEAAEVAAALLKKSGGDVKRAAGFSVCVHFCLFVPLPSGADVILTRTISIIPGQSGMDKRPKFHALTEHVKRRNLAGTLENRRRD